MLRRLLKRLRRRRPEPDEIALEKWSTSFSLFKKRRFAEESRDDFAAFYGGGAFHLRLKKKNLFAWALYGPYRYRNLTAEMNIFLDPDNGHCSAGMMFRYMSEENYYYALVSNRGQFRFDVVINGNPVCLIPWLETGIGPEEGEDSTPLESYSFRVIIHNSSFSFYLNDVWIAELDDETIDTGYLAFCAQNYDENESAEFRLASMRLESRPVEVDIWFYRWTKFIPAPAERRIALAHRLNGQGQHAAALIQLRKAFRSAEPDLDGLFELAETYLSLEMYDDALQHIEECLRHDPEHQRARLERANILYLQNRFIDTKSYLSDIIEDYEGHSAAWNLLGNAEYALGNWTAAADAYLRALELEPEMPIFLLNAARAFDQAGDTGRAEARYAEAARCFFRQEAYDELPPIFERIKQIAPDNPVYRTVHGKTLFAESRYQEAEGIFQGLIEEGSAESEIFFLEGLLKAGAEEHGTAVDLFDSAIERQPDFYLYWLKKAESEYFSGQNPEASLAKARELQPDDGWVRNLSGLVYLERGDLPAARRELEAALRVLPDEEEVKINLSQVLFNQEGIEAAVQRLDMEKGASRNQAGNLCARAGQLDDAIEHYRAAVQMEPDNPVFRENLAAALWEAGLINEAEENLARLLENNPGARAYELIGQVAYEKGEYSRAVAAWKAALELDPGSDRLKLLFSRGLMHAGEIEQARRIAGELTEGPEKEGARQILDRIHGITHYSYTCAECGRQWWVPRDIPEQKQLKLVGEPPAEMPAGKCPVCGRVYCVGCASKHLRNGRFVCPHCDTGLKLLDDGLKYLALQFVELEKNP
jgi:tetratricopeptide (TPR) repeat protein